MNLAQAPEALLRRLSEITQLTVALSGDTGEATITIKLPADDLPHMAITAERINETMITTRELGAQQAPGSCVDAVRAPGRIRTCDTGFRRAVLYPLSYGGVVDVSTVEGYRPRCGGGQQGRAGTGSAGRAGRVW